MSKRTTLPLIRDCQDCGACCQHMRTPPHIVCLREDGTFGSHEGQEDADNEDLDRLLAAPEEARRILIEGLYSNRPDESPCSWLDQETKQCRFHEFRPDVCRDFEIGGEGCRRHRQRAGMDGAKTFTMKNGKLVEAVR